MKHYLSVAILAVAQLTLLPSSSVAAEQTSLEIKVGPGGRLDRLAIPGKNAFPLSEAGGFRAYDATARKSIPLAPTSLRQTGGGMVCECEGDGIRLHALFTTGKAFVRVSGELENTRGDERGVILDYVIPPISPEAVFSNGLDHALRMAVSDPYEGNVYPIAAMCGELGGIGVAIPPSDPRVFGMASDAQGMSARFYLGLSPEPKRFPNRASFTFLLYSVEPDWGFRSALAAYYRFFPDYYTPRLKRDGLFMFQMEDRVPPNIDQYGFDLVESQWKPEVLRAAILRDEQHGIPTFPYMIVGQREIKFLPALPKDYDEAMAAYAKWTLDDHAGHAWTKENAASQGDIHLKEEVESSACKTSDGRYSLVIRNTPWGANSVSFKINPSPDLFQDVGRPTVASYAFELMEQWLKEQPQYDGMYIDSLGANWPALLNYRKDHFAYARYPLTFDPEGRVALQNDLSHYEYIETLRKRMRADGKLILANGVYAYRSKGAPPRRRPTPAKRRDRTKPGVAPKPKALTSKPAERQVVDRRLQEFRARTAPPEHYRAGTKLGRFFCAALLDVASSEAGVRAVVERCQDVRVFMGKKHYAFLNYSWDDAAKVEEFVNKSLCYGIFASSTTVFVTGVHYEDHPNGYLRDKTLLDWYVPLVRRLSRAGWEPVRYAAVDCKDASCERFGNGEVVYYTLYNDATNAAACTLELDLKSLGFDEKTAVVREIARGTPLARPKPNTVTLPLEPKRTCVIQIARQVKDNG
jgi:hypothetical protein